MKELICSLKIGAQPICKDWPHPRGELDLMKPAETSHVKPISFSIQELEMPELGQAQEVLFMIRKLWK